jgi:predicted nucleic-acid-binding protein
VSARPRIPFDTNVVVRLVVHDDEEQCRLAEKAFRSAVLSGGAWIANVVLVEVSWVLRVAYKFDRATIAAALRRLCATEGVRLEDSAMTELALGAYEKGPADWRGVRHMAQRARGPMLICAAYVLPRSRCAFRFLGPSSNTRESSPPHSLTRSFPGSGSMRARLRALESRRSASSTMSPSS